MVITTTSKEPFEKLFMDVVGPLPLTENGNKYILTLQDDLTKYSCAHPLPQHDATTVATCLVEKFICIFGVPKIILTDQGKEFTSKLFAKMSKALKMKHVNCTAYHPQTNGALERSHQTLADYLKNFTSEPQNDWDKWIPFAMFSYNTSVHSTTKLTPFELLFGIKANLPNSLTTYPEFQYYYEDYVEEMLNKMKQSRQLARENSLQAKEINKTYYDKTATKKQFEIGDLVLLTNEQTMKNRTKKLSPRYAGPYQIVGIDPPVNYIIQMGSKKMKTHANRLKYYDH